MYDVTDYTATPLLQNLNQQMQNLQLLILFQPYFLGLVECVCFFFFLILAFETRRHNKLKFIDKGAHPDG